MAGLPGAISGPLGSPGGFGETALSDCGEGGPGQREPQRPAVSRCGSDLDCLIEHPARLARVGPEQQRVCVKRQAHRQGPVVTRSPDERESSSFHVRASCVRAGPVRHHKTHESVCATFLAMLVESCEQRQGLGAKARHQARVTCPQFQVTASVIDCGAQPRRKRSRLSRGLQPESALAPLIRRSWVRAPPAPLRVLHIAPSLMFTYASDILAVALT